MDDDLQCPEVPWCSWSYTGRTLPRAVHQDAHSLDQWAASVKWHTTENDGEPPDDVFTLSPEAILLGAGMVLRDLYAVQFSADPGEEETPTIGLGGLPAFLSMSKLSFDIVGNVVEPAMQDFCKKWAAAPGEGPTQMRRNIVKGKGRAKGPPGIKAKVAKGKGPSGSSQAPTPPPPATPSPPSTPPPKSTSAPASSPRSPSLPPINEGRSKRAPKPTPRMQQYIETESARKKGQVIGKEKVTGDVLPTIPEDGHSHRKRKKDAEADGQGATTKRSKVSEHPPKSGGNGARPEVHKNRKASGTKASHKAEAERSINSKAKGKAKESI